MKKILILSGAGLSKESGLNTFRDKGGLWEKYDFQKLASKEAMIYNREEVREFYDFRRKQLIGVQPNIAHISIAKLKKEFPENITVMTQNVDDLLERAKCPDVIHLHGTLKDGRCEMCSFVFDIGFNSTKGLQCPKCKNPKVRHNVVMFGEKAPMYQTLFSSLDKHDIFVVIGTSGRVIDVASMSSLFELSIINNLNPEPYVDDYFTKVIHKRATEGIIEIEEIIRGQLEQGTIS